MTSVDDDTDHPTLGRRPRLMAWLLLMPLLGWLVLFVLAPTLIMLLISFGQKAPLGQVTFTTTDVNGNPQWVDMTQNYARVITAHQIKPVVLSLIPAALVALLAWRVTKLDWFRYSSFGGMGSTVIFSAGLLGYYLCINWLVMDWPGSAMIEGWVNRWWPSGNTIGTIDSLKVMVVSINYAAIATFICVVGGYPVAYFIGKAPDRWRNLLLMMVMIPFWTNFLVRTYAWVTILRSEGVLNSLLINLGVIATPLDLYPSSLAVMIGLVYTYLPFMILPIYGSVERLDNAVVEAALDLGASPLRAFQSVIMPLTRPGVVAGVLLVFVPAVGMFAVNDILGGRREILIGNMIEDQFNYALNRPFGATLGTMLLVMFVLVYFFATRRRKGAV